jgi:hypothetical protein
MFSEASDQRFGKSSLSKSSWNRSESAPKLCNRVVSQGISTVFSTGVENSGDSPNEHM